MEEWLVDTVDNGEAAVAVLETAGIDLVILDWMLPGTDGLQVLQHLRARHLQVPVLMLTARTALDDRVLGLESGADDYLTKPFAFAELLARCRALLRRPSVQTARVLTHADLHLDTRARVAVRAGVEIPLTPREVDVLEYLMQYQGQIVTREMLQRDVWKQVSRATSLDNVIDVQMMRLRRKVDTEGHEPLIHTIRGVGYRFGKDAE